MREVKYNKEFWNFAMFSLFGTCSIQKNDLLNLTENLLFFLTEYSQKFDWSFFQCGWLGIRIGRFQSIVNLVVRQTWGAIAGNSHNHLPNVSQIVGACIMVTEMRNPPSALIKLDATPKYNQRHQKAVTNIQLTAVIGEIDLGKSFKQRIIEHSFSQTYRSDHAKATWTRLHMVRAARATPNTLRMAHLFNTCMILH